MDVSDSQWLAAGPDGIIETQFYSDKGFAGIADNQPSADEDQWDTVCREEPYE